jgi:hypothetical protein
MPVIITGPEDSNMSINIWSFIITVKSLPVTRPKFPKRSWPARITPRKSVLLRKREATNELPTSCKALPANKIIVY